MAKGVAISFKSYEETIPKLLNLIKVESELKKYDKIVLKPCLTHTEYPQLKESLGTNTKFVEEVLKYIIKHKNPVTEVLIAEGSDGFETEELFESYGYKQLAEKYPIGLIDLNNTETQEIIRDDFLRFEEIKYPKILMESFVISLPKLSEDSETEIAGSLSNMLGAFPSKHYKGFFSRTKTKIRKWPIKYSIHDISKCKLPNLAIIDASEQGKVLSGQPLAMDNQAAKLLNKDPKSIAHLKLLNESFNKQEE